MGVGNPGLAARPLQRQGRKTSCGNRIDKSKVFAWLREWSTLPGRPSLPFALPRSCDGSHHSNYNTIDTRPTGHRVSTRPSAAFPPQPLHTFLVHVGFASQTAVQYEMLNCRQH